MEKVKLSSFGIIPNIEEKEITIGDAVIIVKNHISYEQVLDLIQFVVNYILGERKFISEPIVKMFTDFAIIKFYTNIDLTRLELVECEPSEIYEMYDILKTFNVIDIVRESIDAEQLSFVDESLYKTIESIIKYRDSAAGLIDRIAENADTNNAAIQESLDILNQPEQLAAVNKVIEFVDRQNVNE